MPARALNRAGPAGEAIEAVSGPPAAPAPWKGLRLSSLLAAQAERRPEEPFLGDGNGARGLGRSFGPWRYGSALAAVRRLAGSLRGLGLPAGAPVGLCLPNAPEACLALLAADFAALTPCLLPIDLDDEPLGRALEAAQIQAVVTQSRVGEHRPAEAFSRLAVRCSGLRFLLSFGPDVPDGVVGLDQVLMQDASSAETADAQRPGAHVTFAREDPPAPEGGTPAPLLRTTDSLVAATAIMLREARIRPDDRLVSLLPPSSHRGLVTGLCAALLSGASLECHALFHGADLAAALAGPRAAHLVAPAWLEPALARADLPSTVASVVLVHDAPLRFRARDGLRRPVVDVLALGEAALIARARPPGGQLAFSPDEGAALAASSLLRVSYESGGEIFLEGLAAEMVPYGRSPRETSQRFRAERFAGLVVGIA